MFSSISIWDESSNLNETGNVIWECDLLKPGTIKLADNPGPFSYNYSFLFCHVFVQQTEKVLTYSKNQDVFE